MMFMFWSPKVSSLLSVCLFACMGCAGQTVKTEPGSPAAEVALNVVDQFGNPLRPTEVKFIRANGTDLSRNVHDGLVEVPYGGYELRVLVPGFELWEGSIQVSQPRLLLTIGMRLGAIDGPKPYCQLRGHVVGLDKKSHAWLRLLPVYGNEILSVDVAESGDFDFAKAECGVYIVAVIRGPSKMQFITITLTGDTKPLTISPE